MENQGLKELTEAAFIIPCSAKHFRSDHPSRRVTTRSSQAQQEDPSSSSSSSHLSLAFPRIHQCENDHLPSDLRERAYSKCCQQVEDAVQRALDTLYSPTLSDIQELILSHHQQSLHDETQHSIQDTFFLPGEDHSHPSTLTSTQERVQDQSEREPLKRTKGRRIGTAVLAGSIPSPHQFFSKLSRTLSNPTSQFKSTSHPKALLISLPSSSCSSLSQAWKTLNLRFRSAWSSNSQLGEHQMDLDQDDDDDEDEEEDEIDSSNKRKKGKTGIKSTGDGQVKKGKDLDGKDLKSWWNNLPSPRPNLILHLPSLESFDPFPLSDLVLSLHSLNSNLNSNGQESLPISLILGLETSRKALNSILPWNTLEKLEVGDVPLPRADGIWENLMSELFLNPLHPLTVQIDSQTIEFMRVKYLEMDADFNDVLKAFQLSYLHHFTSRPISSFAFSQSLNSISDLSSSFTEDYIWSLRKLLLEVAIYDDDPKEANSVDIGPLLEMLQSINPQLNNKIKTSNKGKGKESDENLNSSLAALSQILRDPSPIPLFLAINTQETISRIRSLKRLCGISMIFEILSSNSKESSLISGLSRSSHSKVPSKFQIFIEASRSASEDLELRSKGIKSIKGWLSNVETILCKSGLVEAESDDDDDDEEDSDWAIKMLSDLLSSIETMVEGLREGIRSRTTSLNFLMTNSDEMEEESEESENGSDPDEDVERVLERLESNKQKKENSKRRVEDEALHWIIEFREEVKESREELRTKIRELRELDETGNGTGVESSPSGKGKGKAKGRDHDLVRKQVTLKDEIEESRKGISKLVRSCLENFLLPDPLPFDSIHLTQFSRTLSHTLHSQERSNLSLALDNPQHVLRDLLSTSNPSSEHQDQEESRKLMTSLDQAEEMGMKPDVVRAFEAYREAGTLINLGDWWEMFKQGVEDSEERWKAKWGNESQEEDEEEGDITIRGSERKKRGRTTTEDDEDSPQTPSKRQRLDSANHPKTPTSSTSKSQNENDDTPSSSRSQRQHARSLKLGPETKEKRNQEDLQARFAIAVNHLAMMGLLKKTSRRAEHTMRTNWEIPPKIAKEQEKGKGKGKGRRA